jgi:hypothetical protein
MNLIGSAVVVSAKSIFIAAMVLLAPANYVLSQSASDITANQTSKVNFASVEQGADNNDLVLRQSGSRNIANGIQNGLENQAAIYQHGPASKLRLEQNYRLRKHAQNATLPFFNNTSKIQREAVEQNGYITYVLRYRNRDFDLLSVTESLPVASSFGRNR